MQGRESWLLPFAVAVSLAALAGRGGPDQAAAQTDRTQSSRALEARRVLARIEVERDETWRWQGLMGVALTRHVDSARRTTSLEYRRWVLGLWTRRALLAGKRVSNPPPHAQWLCIHRYEGPWDADTGNGYYGGLQMDLEFQRTYGSRLLRTKGTADTWTPLEQIWVAERAYESGRGFYPWPNTARYCGLI